MILQVLKQGQRVEVTDNVFCPTGQGGGVDPTCSSGSGSSSIPMGGYKGLKVPKMNAADRSVLQDYQENSYEINGSLREGIGNAPSDVQAKAIKFKRMFEKNAITTKQDMIVYRGVEKHEESVVRGQQKSWTSTTTDPKSAAFFGEHIMAIKVPKGTKVLPVLAGEENEVILPQWSTFTPGKATGTVERKGREAQVISYDMS